MSLSVLDTIPYGKLSFKDKGDLAKKLNHDELSRIISQAAMKAAILEAAVTPKPGLVSVDCQGAHDDMDFGTFVDSALILGPYFAEVFELGFSAKYWEFDLLRPIFREAGTTAVDDMLYACRGANTHKGLVFSLGLICAGLGIVLSLDYPVNILTVCHTASDFIKGICETDFKPLREAASLHQKQPQRDRLFDVSDFTSLYLKRDLSTGERLFLEYGTKGVRGEAEGGFPNLILAFDTLSKNLKQGFFNEAAVNTLLVLMSKIEDTNVLGRGGLKGLKFMHKRAKKALDLGGMSTSLGQNEVLKLRKDMIARRLSPGGCADLVTIAVFFNILGIGF
jgi:triphosphoribosyl-dephospho-CoA synthetase